jgi:hypothetical protein
MTVTIVQENIQENFNYGETTSFVKQQNMGWIYDCSSRIIGIYLLLYTAYSW